MPSKRLSVEELFLAILKRPPNDWEREHWSGQLDAFVLEEVIARLTDSTEHRDLLRNRELMFKPAGHFYSPVVDTQFIAERHDAIFGPKVLVDGIDLNLPAQVEFAAFANAAVAYLPFGDEPTEGLRYHYRNGAFVWGDACVYAAMLMKHRPGRIIEIGSGYSSALALDVIEMIDGYEPTLNLFDPYPQLVEQLLADHPSRNVAIEGKFIQDVGFETLSGLEAGDFYFMDTTHIVKTGSDVLYHFEEVLPRLKSGVILHLHDIFWPFEYPPSWVLENRLSWNELYYFRAFLTRNPDYEILFFNNYIHSEHRHLMADVAPFQRNGGASIWLRKR